VKIVTHISHFFQGFFKRKKRGVFSKKNDLPEAKMGAIPQQSIIGGKKPQLKKKK